MLSLGGSRCISGEKREREQREDREVGEILARCSGSLQDHQSAAQRGPKPARGTAGQIRQNQHTSTRAQGSVRPEALHTLKSKNIMNSCSV